MIASYGHLRSSPASYTRSLIGLYCRIVKLPYLNKTLRTQGLQGQSAFLYFVV
jgi:hypothetical protein